jgi:D-alanyl-D-alanine carboxypeptidase/D-alanyl-D-alanine-endopeptidase (penicillin-binding protein 4)
MRLRSSRVAPFLATLAISGCLLAQPLVSTSAAPPTGVDDLQRDLDRALGPPIGEQASWAVLARSLKNDETLYALNAHKLLIPASAMKIVTLAASAERLGWDFAYDTRLFAVGSVDSGVLRGDLVVVGSGDPSLTEENASALFTSWAERLKTDGIRAVSGRIIGDGRAFDGDEQGPGWSWDDLGEGFAAGVKALQYNGNVVRAQIVPARTVGAAPTISLTPDGSGLAVVNLLRTGSAESRLSVSVRRGPASARLQLRGSVPLGGGPFERSLAVVNPTVFFVTQLRQALIADGVAVSGPPVDIDEIVDAPSPKGPPTVTYRSPPLSALAVTLMKVSQNLYAETFLKTVGAAAGEPTFEGGRAAVRSTLSAWGLPDAELILADGSGLSRYGYATAQMLVDILTHVDRDQRLRGPFVASLPIAGFDGTLAGRLGTTAASGTARAKTGSMTGVRALAGYVTSRGGEPVVFAIMANNFATPPDAITRAIDVVVARLAEFRR